MNDATPPTPVRDVRARGWRVPAAILVAAFLTYAGTAAFEVISLDVRAANIASWRIAETGAPWIEGLSIPELDHNRLRSTWVLEAPNGHTVIGRTPGAVLAGLPAYALAGGPSFSLAPGALTAALLTACTVLLVFLTLRPLLSTLAAALAAAAFGFTTPVWSVAANGIWPHTVTILGIAGMSWATTTRRWWLVGLFGGVVMWGRLHAAVIVAVLGLYLAWRRREPGIAVRLGTAGGAALVLLCAWSRWMYGSWDPTASYDTSIFENYAASHRFDLVNQLGMWVALDRGVLVWTPIVLVLLPGLFRAWRHLPDWTRGLLWAGLIYTVLQATLNQFIGGDAFYGYRLTLEFLACATPALALSVRHSSRRMQLLVGPVLAAQWVAILVGATFDSFFVAGKDVWSENAFVLAVNANAPILLPLLVVAVCIAPLAQRRIEMALDASGVDAAPDARQPTGARNH